MSRRKILEQENRRCARLRWGTLSQELMEQLRFLTRKFGLAVAQSEVQLLNGRWYVTHNGLLAIAQRKKCAGIRTMLIRELCDASSRRWVLRAVVYKTPGSPGFGGFGDADPSNVSTVVQGAELRIAETRAVNRALRKAYGIGLCSIEELGSSIPLVEGSQSKDNLKIDRNNNCGQTYQPRLRDQLSLLIRKYQLNSDLVKRYAADFCGTEVLRDAWRDLVESFIANLAEQAAGDLNSLTCKLNSYAHGPVTTL